MASVESGDCLAGFRAGHARRHSNAFSQAALLGCLYHLAKNVRLHVSREGLLARYDDDADFALQVRMIVALAFVPHPDVELAFETLEDTLPGELQPVLAYFEVSALPKSRKLISNKVQ